MNKRQYINPEKRKTIYEKFNGHCAYCGKEIEYTDMQVDHITPLRLGGKDDIDNMFPSCRRCNHYKRGNSLEGFRTAIEAIPIKLFRDNYIYKVGIDYGLLPTGKQSIKFYFEQVQEEK